VKKVLVTLKINGMNKLLIGFSAGLLLGILFAPAKGSETRESISSRGRDLKNKFNDLVDSITDKFDSMKEEAEDLAEPGRQTVRSFKNEMT
jgi:gas vesicle protein